MSTIHAQRQSPGDPLARRRRTEWRALLMVPILAALVACGDSGGGGDGGGAASFGGGGGGGSSASAEAMAAFQGGVYTLLRQNCASCHAGAGPGTPHIAHPDAATAYQTILSNQKVNFTTPSQSRLVRRLVADFHYCWNDCVMNGAEMQAAIEAWALAAASGSSGSGQQVQGLASTSATLDDGFEPEGGDRYEENVIAMWGFKEETGTTAFDESGVAPAADLELTGNATLMTSYGVDFEGGKAEADATSSRKIYDYIADPTSGTQQYSVEAWVQPDNIEQGDNDPARVFTYSSGTGQRNFALDQREYLYEVSNRSIEPEINDNGAPALQTYDADQDAQAALQHVVVTYDQYRGRRIYVNGTWTDDIDEQAGNRLWNWDPGHRVVFGNETSNNRSWEGQLRFAAIYPYVLTDAQIQQNFAAGIGKRLLIRFDVSQWAGAGSYIEFVVSEFDDYSYMFCTPTFVTPNPTGFRVGNLRIRVNAQVPVSGQSFINVDTIITAPQQVLSQQCSVVSKENGPALDVFTIDFEFLNGFEDPVPPTDPGSPPAPVFTGPFPSEGFRDFARINETMAEVTGVDPNSGGAADVKATYQDIQAALPAGPDLRAFSAATEVSIAKLAVEYCDALVQDPTLRTDLFGTFPWASPPDQVFNNPANRDQIVQALIDHAYGMNVPNQPTMVEVVAILEEDDMGDPAGGLLDRLLPAPLGTCVANCPNTEEIVTGLCTSVLASAPVAVH